MGPVGAIQGRYDDLGDAIRAFSREADDTGNLLDRVNHAVRGLENGGWIGEGADMFYQEMNYEVLPAVRRLVSALQDSAQAVQQIVKIFQQADYEAGHLFRGEGGHEEIEPGGGSNPLELGDLAGGMGYNFHSYKVGEINPPDFTDEVSPGDIVEVDLGGGIGGSKMQDIHFNVGQGAHGAGGGGGAGITDGTSNAASTAVHLGGVNMGDGSVTPNPGGAQMQDIHFNSADDDIAKKIR